MSSLYEFVLDYLIVEDGKWVQFDQMSDTKKFQQI